MFQKFKLLTKIQTMLLKLQTSMNLTTIKVVEHLHMNLLKRWLKMILLQVLKI